MIENGPEKATQFDDNVVVRSRPLDVGVSDDMAPACYWYPSGNTVSRHNVGYLCTFGYRFNPKGKIGKTAPINQFLNNS